MRRHVPIILAGIAMAAAFGCRDIAVPSAATPASSGISASLIPVSNGNSGTVSCTVNPNQASTCSVLGLFVVNFPAHSVCALNSSYGPTHWYDPCSTITAPLTVTATVQNTHGRIWVDFSPSIRFVPSNNPNLWVTISDMTHAAYVIAHGGNSTLGILWATSIGAVPQVDWSGDPTLAPVFNRHTGLIWRRILHFTGYNVITGDECDPTDGDPYCIDDGNQNNN
jgi:hypothetical protein